jgi:predicted nucleic acid-binding protein
LIHGLDTSFMVQLEVARHPGHEASRALFDRLLDSGESFALAPQVLAEFVHIVTDSNRFEQPLPVSRAIARVEHWWQARDVVPVFPNDTTVARFHAWMREHALGRKRLLDTMLAATYFTNDVRSILSTNARDFAVFGCFSIPN